VIRLRTKGRLIGAAWGGRDSQWRSDCCYDHSVLNAPLAQLAEQRTLNPRVRGSSPWRRTRSDLGFYHSRSFFMRPVCPDFLAVLAPCLLVGRMLGPGWLVHFRRIGLDHPIGVPSDAVTERDNRRWRLAAGLAPWFSFLVAMESGAACGRTSAPPEPTVLAGHESPPGADPGQGASFTWAVSGSARPGPSWVHEGYIYALASHCAALPGSSGTRHGPAWTAAGTPGAPYGGKQGCAPTAASPRAAVRRIGLVPSKIVKILDYGTISAVQRPCEGPWYQHGSSTRCSRVAAVRTRAKKAPPAYSPPVHLRHISALTCQYSFCRRDVALRSTIREGPLGRATHGPDVRRRFHPGPAVVGPTRRHHGADRP
jgi:hypothetical protein